MEDGQHVSHSGPHARGAIHDSAIPIRVVGRGSHKRSRILDVHPIPDFLPSAKEGGFTSAKLQAGIPEELLAQVWAVNREETDNRHIQPEVPSMAAA
jgi:hypothetical protein